MSENASTGPLRVDAHHHVWDLDVRDQPWTADLPVLRRSFSIADLRPELESHRIDGTVLVQTVCVPEETPELLALAAGEVAVLGVVGWVDLTGPDVGEQLATFRALPGGDRLVAIRHQVQLEPDPRWLLREDVRRGLAAVASAGLAYDLVVLPGQLPWVVEAVGKLPELRFVLDHAGKPPIASGGLAEWRKQLSALAACDHVSCKLSGLVTEAPEDWSEEQLAPVAEHVLTSFGPDRVLAGSDWPVCLLRTSYDEVVAMTDRFLASLSPEEQLDVWGGSAQRWYGLSARNTAVAIPGE